MKQETFYQRVVRSKKLLFLIAAICMLLPLFMIGWFSIFPTEEVMEYLQTRGAWKSDEWMKVVPTPTALSGEQFASVFSDNEIVRSLGLSVFYTVLITVGRIVFAPMMAFALTQFRFRGQRTLTLCIMMLMLLPFQVTMVPTTILLREMGTLNTIWSVILPMWFSPFYIFLVQQYMAKFPREIIEASQVDGAGTVRCYIKIMLPACRHAVGAVIALSFAECWNLTAQPLAFLRNNPELWPSSAVYHQVANSISDTVFAEALICMVPAWIIYAMFRKDIGTGIQLGDLK